jgi:broad specificity phosphatase PhoE
MACRHGESVGNVARASAEARGLIEVDTPVRDAALPLTALGHHQAQTLGRRIAALPADERPTRIIASPHRRALETAEGILRAGYDSERVGFSVDRRLTPKAFGVLERLTRRGVVARLPHLAELRERVGRFHFRPPGGESRCDVVLRVRDFVDELRARDDGERVLVVTHQIVVNALAWLAGDGAGDALSTNADGNVANAHLHTFSFDAPTRTVQPREAACA